MREEYDYNKKKNLVYCDILLVISLEVFSPLWISDSAHQFLQCYML